MLSNSGGTSLIDWFSCSWWQHAANLASYEQQDAHEFFISMLDGIHEKMGKDKRKTQSQGKFFIGANISVGFSCIIRYVCLLQLGDLPVNCSCLLVYVTPMRSQKLE